MSSKSIEWVDNAKFLGIFLVVLGHVISKGNGCYNNGVLLVIYRFIYLFHMPLFFVVSGFLYKKYGRVRKLILALVIPYLMYQIVYLPVSIVHFKQHNDTLLTIIKCIMGIITGDGYETCISNPVCAPCWFIYTIILIRLFFEKIEINNHSAIIISSSCFLYMYFQNMYGWDLYFNIDTMIASIPFFLLGVLLRKTLKVTSGGGDILRNLSLAVITFSLVMMVAYMSDGAQMNGPQMNCGVVFFYISGIAGFFFIYYLSSIRNTFFHKYIELISRHTLFIIFYHWLLVVFVGKSGVIDLIGSMNSSAFEIIFSFVISFVILISSIPVISILRKKFPIVLGKYSNISKTHVSDAAR